MKRLILYPYKTKVEIVVYNISIVLKRIPQITVIVYSEIQNIQIFGIRYELSTMYYLFHVNVLYS